MKVDKLVTLKTAAEAMGLSVSQARRRLNQLDRERRDAGKGGVFDGRRGRGSILRIRAEALEDELRSKQTVDRIDRLESELAENSRRLTSLRESLRRMSVENSERWSAQEKVNRWMQEVASGMQELRRLSGSIAIV